LLSLVKLTFVIAKLIDIQPKLDTRTTEANYADIAVAATAT